MAERSVIVRLQANIADFKAQMEQAKRSAKGVGDETEKSSTQANTALGRMTQSAQKNREAWDTAGTALAGFGAVAAAGLGMSIKAAMDWESAWAGVTKTVEGTPAQLQAVEDGLRGLARELPATHEEIAAVAEAAGQLGVQTESVVDFTRTMVNLGETTNLSADEAATSLAQMMNVMQTAPEDVGRMGASLVALGNAGASTEAEIMNMAQRLSGAGRLIGASESDILALSNAMASMGINAELGGGVMTRVMQRVYTAVQDGGSALESFADVAGMSSREFAEAFEQDPIRAVDAFIQGLNRVDESGGNVVSTLRDLGMRGTEEMSVLLQLKGAGDLLAESLDLGNQAWEENTALVEEAAKRYDTTASQIAIARNNIHDAAIEIGEAFLPVLATLAESVAGLAGWFADLPDPIQGVVGGLAGIASVGGLAAGAFLLLFPRVIETYKAFQTLNTVSPGVASGLGAIGRAAGIVGAIGAVAIAVDELTDSFGPAPETMEETTAALLNVGESMEEVDARFAELSPRIGGQIDGLAGAAERLANPSLMNRLDAFFAEVQTFGRADGDATRERIIEQINQMGESLALMVQSGNAELAARQFELLSAEWERGGGTVEDLRDMMPAYTAALQEAENQQRIAAESAGGLATATANIAPSVESIFGSLESYYAYLGHGEEATQELIDKANELGETLAGFVDPLGLYMGFLDEKIAKERDAAGQTEETGQRGQEAWRQFVNGANIAFDEYLAALEQQVRDQETWQVNMLRLAGRVSQGTLEELARMGPEGAPLVADLVNRSDAELDRFDEVTRRRSQEATDAWGQQLTLARPVLAEIARTNGQEVVNRLAAELLAGTTTVAQIAAQYGVELADGINPILTSLGKASISIGNRAAQQRAGRGLAQADGSVMDFYADGGMEDHVAQIAPAGAWRVWAEPETGGEAYIPLHPGKRSRSVDIWRETGRRLGVEFAEFAVGGFTGVDDVPRPRSTAPYGAPISTAGDAAMQKLYDETTAWLLANTEAIFGGIPGSGGALAGGSGRVAQLFNTVKAAFPQARLNSGLRPGDPGYHGRGMAVDLGQIGRAGGNGHPYLAAMNRWIYDNFGSQTKELIYDGLGDDRPDLKNGRPLTYNAATRAQHRNHVHWAMAKGGILNPHVRDVGGPLLPGYTFNGTGAPEWVVPINQKLTDVRSQTPTVVVTAPAGGGDRPYIGELHQHLQNGPSTAEIAGEIMHSLRVVSRGGKYVGAR